jgi:hypothetical protein
MPQTGGGMPQTAVRTRKAGGRKSQTGDRIPKTGEGMPHSGASFFTHFEAKTAENEVLRPKTPLLLKSSNQPE